MHSLQFLWWQCMVSQICCLGNAQTFSLLFWRTWCLLGMMLFDVRVCAYWVYVVRFEKAKRCSLDVGRLNGNTGATKIGSSYRIRIVRGSDSCPWKHGQRIEHGQSIEHGQRIEHGKRIEHGQRIDSWYQRQSTAKVISFCLFVCWCLEPSQPLGVILGLNKNLNLSLSYSAHEPFNINHNLRVHISKQYRSKRQVIWLQI